MSCSQIPFFRLFLTAYCIKWPCDYCYNIDIAHYLQHVMLTGIFNYWGLMYLLMFFVCEGISLSLKIPDSLYIRQDIPACHCYN